MFEERAHVHQCKLTKAELMRHLKVPHRQSTGGWTSLVSEPRGWKMEELVREHQRFHEVEA